MSYVYIIQYNVSASTLENFYGYGAKINLRELGFVKMTKFQEFCNLYNSKNILPKTFICAQIHLIHIHRVMLDERPI